MKGSMGKEDRQIRHLDEANLHSTRQWVNQNSCEDTQPTLFATSNASWSDVNRTYAFFLPSGLHGAVMSISAMIMTPPNHSPDESVDSCRLDIVQLLYRILDLALVRLDIHNEDKRVVLFDLFHGRFSAQGPSKVSERYPPNILEGSTHETIVLNWSIRGT